MIPTQLHQVVIVSGQNSYR